MARLVYQRGTSSKFWEGTVTGSAVTVLFGRIGTAGQTRVTKCGSPAAAAALLAKVTAEKRAKGYVPSGGAKATPAARAKAKQPPPKLPAGRVAALVGLARRLGDASLVTDVTLAATDPAAYFRKFKKRLEDIHLDDPADKELPWHSLLLGLEARKRLASLDWKQEAVDTIAWIRSIAGNAGKAALAPMAKQPDLASRATDEALELAGAALTTAHLAVVQLDTNSDSYEMIVVPAGDVKLVGQLARAAGGSITHFSGKRLAALERERVRANMKEAGLEGHPWFGLAEHWRRTTHGVLLNLAYEDSTLDEVRAAAAYAPARDRAIVAMTFSLYDQPASKVARTTRDPKLCLRALEYLAGPQHPRERLAAAAILAGRLRITPGTGALQLQVGTACSLRCEHALADRASRRLPAATRQTLARIADGLVKGARYSWVRNRVGLRALGYVGDAESIPLVGAQMPPDTPYWANVTASYREAITCIRARVGT